MTNKKPVVDKGIIIYNDYEYLFNFLNDEELGKTIRLLMKNHTNPILDPSNNKNINNVYNYIANRIIDYQARKGFYSKCGKQGGNPTLKGTLKGGVNPGDKLKEKKRKEKKIKKNKIKEMFNEFYKMYPLKKGKVEGEGKFFTLFSNLTNEEAQILFDKMKKGLASYCKECTNTESKFIKHFSTYMNNKSWEDDFGEVDEEIVKKIKKEKIEDTHRERYEWLGVRKFKKKYLEEFGWKEVDLKKLFKNNGWIYPKN